MSVCQHSQVCVNVSRVLKVTSVPVWVSASGWSGAVRDLANFD